MATISSLQKGLVAYYPLNGTYLANDTTPNSNNGTITEAVLGTGIKGESNGSYVFDGSNDKIDCGNPSILNFGTGSFSISALVNSDQTGTTKFICGKTDGINSSNSKGYSLYLGSTGTVWMFGVWDGSNNIALSSGVSGVHSTWVHVTGVYDSVSKIAYVYVNGVLRNQTATNLGSIDVANNFLIGGVTSSFWDGKVTDVRVYNRVLSSTEVTLLYNKYKDNISTSSLQKGLIAHYPLDGTNLADDITPNANDGSITGATLSTGIKGEANGAYLFNGTNQGISVASNTTQELTLQGSVSAWFKCTGSTGTVRMIVDKYNSGLAYGFAIFINAVGGLDFRLGNKGKTINTVNYTDSLWHNVVMTSDGITMNFYVDGVNIGTDTAPTSHTAGSRTLSIGYRVQDNSFHFPGSIADVKIYNRGLTVAEVKAIYDGFKPKGSTSSLNKGLVFDSCLTTKCLKSSTLIGDRTPNQQDGTLINAPTVGTDGTLFTYTDSEYVTATNRSLTTPGASWTTSIWFKSSDLSTPRGMLAFSDSSNLRNEVYVTAGNVIRLFQGGNFYLYTSASSYGDNSWHHLVGTFDGSNRYIYIDGVKVTPTLNTSVTAAENPNEIRIGRLLLADTNTQYFFSGTLYGAKIWNRALSETEVGLLYQKGRYA